MLEAGSIIITNCSGECIFSATFHLVFSWNEWRAEYTLRVTRYFCKEQSENLWSTVDRYMEVVFFFYFYIFLQSQKKSQILDFYLPST